MGPLSGIKIVEIGGIGPGPYCAQMLSDMGAEIIRIDKKSETSVIPGAGKFMVNHRGRRSIAIDLKKKWVLKQCWA